MNIIEVTLVNAVRIGEKLELPYMKEALLEAQLDAEGSCIGYVLDYLAEDILTVVKFPTQPVRFFTTPQILQKVENTL